MLVQLPSGGVHRALDIQAQPPFTAPDALNVWPLSGIPGRLTLGSRAGLKPYLRQPLPSGGASGSPINMGAVVNFATTAVNRYIEDDFDSVEGVLDTAWTTPAAFSALSVDSERHTAYADFTSTGAKFGAIRAADSALDITDEVQYAYLLAVPYRGQHRGKYIIYIGQASTPAPGTTGIRLEVSFSGTTDVVTVTGIDGVGTIIVPTAGTNPYTFGHNDVRMIRLQWTTSNVPTVYNLSLYVDNIEVWTYTTPAISIPGHRTGFALEPFSSGDRMEVDWHRWAYPATTSIPRELNQSVWASNGTLCYESAEYTYATLSTLTLASDRPLNAIQLNSKLYIADWGEKIVDVTNPANGRMTLAAGVLTLDANGTVNFVTAGVTTSHVVEITLVPGAWPGATNVVAGVYEISAVAAGALTLTRTSAAGAAGPTAGFLFNIRRGPKVYDPAAQTLTNLVNTNGVDTEVLGVVPVGCPLIEEYRGRLVFGGNGTNWYMSRVFTPTDWDYGTDPADPARAISSTLSTTGKSPQIMTAFLAAGDDYMLMSSLNTLYVMRGDPAYGGDLLPTGKTSGIVASRAACVAPDGIYFLSRNGLERWTGGEPEPTSFAKCPDALKGIDPNYYHPVLIYDGERESVLIFISGKSSYAARVAWMYHIPTGGFWPFYPVFDPQAAVVGRGYYNNANKVLIGGRDGWVYYLERNGKRDQWPGVTFKTRLVLGPFRLSEPMHEGVIQRMGAILSTQDDGCTIAVHVANTPQEAARAAMIESTPLFSQTLSRGRNPGITPRTRGQGACVRLYDAGGTRWRVSELTMDILPGGRSR